VLVPLLRAWDERVDILLLSHRDTDHTGGARAVLDMQRGASLLSSLESGHELHRFGVSTRCMDHREGGQAWDWDGVRLEVVHPRANDYQDGARPNNLSCVLRITNGRQAALLAGDIERAQEMALAERARQDGGPSGLRSDLLLVPHHGSKTSSSPALLEAVRPRLALVQAGYRNRFGHPAPEVIQRYRELGVSVFESTRCGAATWRSSQPLTVDCQRQLVQRYWHHRVP
jgi:competence protein ComEC